MDIFTVRRRLENAFLLQYNMILKKFRPRFINIYMWGGKYVYVYMYINMCICMY